MLAVFVWLQLQTSLGNRGDQETWQSQTTGHDDNEINSAFSQALGTL